MSGVSANPGVAMAADVSVGQSFVKEEVLSIETESAKVQSVTESASSPFGQFENVPQISTGSTEDPE